MSRHLNIFDTTLRDGEQSPGATLNELDKIEIARQLARLGVDIIEAGFPAASLGDLSAVRQIALKVGQNERIGKNGKPAPPPSICGLARANKNDIDKVWEAVRESQNPRIHIFLATSPIHMEYKLKMSPDEVVKRAEEMVAYARAMFPQVEFSPEDAGRSEPEFLYRVLEAVIKAGATVLNIPDTVGYTTPVEYGNLIKNIITNTPGAKDVIISAHCHNDLGLATANCLAGIENGVSQAEVTLNGIGERAGNTALEEIIMALYVRQKHFNIEHNIITQEIHRSSEMVSRLTGIPIQPNKAIVGSNAFAHEAGIHQDGVLKHPQTYEIINAEVIGLSESKLVLGKHSGRHALRKKLVELGFDIATNETMDEIFTRFKELSDKKKHISDHDIEVIAEDVIYKPFETWKIEEIQVQCGMKSIPTAVVRLRHTPTDEIFTEAGFGQGPIDALYQGIDRIVKQPTNLIEFVIQAVTEGMDSVADVSVRIEPIKDKMERETAQGITRHISFYGRGIDTDIIVASARAYIQSLNKIIAAENGLVKENGAGK